MSDDVVERLVAQAQEAFWENAGNGRGEVELPAGANLADPILPPEAAKRVVYNAVPTVLALWREVEWRPHYLGFMGRECRLELWSETQLAFIEALFGLSQGLVARATASKLCIEAARATVTGQMR